ncbi:LysR family transcriptional regulator, regulator of abg operon [Colwellia chukchiensis]|uniref:LysR family transcriptional regulator, regulator of abg operon n=1 Tax=Colwellia chukchiensis TaxID=641665 RepID=A0A1H7KSM4_9GAMM|nr:LysR family transcriptional regulator [Colwellia chukchiensis]SEK89055.1 LysR family transcriptional regulator, regulator of abg operon [Colwellia chukchiensis]
MKYRKSNANNTCDYEGTLLKINQINAFIAIAEGNGVAGAAQKLYVSQPAITKSISNLESELGVALFDRSKHRLKLNKYGEILLRRAKAAKAELKGALEEITLMKDRSQQSIKFNGSPALIPRLIPKAINLFKLNHPDVHVELAGLLDDNPANKIQALIKGEYDLLITVIDEKVVFRNLCHFSIINKIGVTHDSIFRLQQSIS